MLAKRKRLSRSPYQSSKPETAKSERERRGQRGVQLLAGVEAPLRRAAAASQRTVVVVEQVELARRAPQRRGGRRRRRRRTSATIQASAVSEVYVLDGAAAPTAALSCGT